MNSASSRQHELKTEFEKLFAKSVAAQSLVLKQGVGFLKNAVKNKSAFSHLSSKTKDVLADVFTKFAKLQLDHTSKMIDLGLTVVYTLFSGVDDKVFDKSQQSYQTDNLSNFVISMNGSLGNLSQAAFILESSKKDPIKARFQYSSFIMENSYTILEIPISFDPSVVLLRPGNKVKIIIGVPIPHDAEPGIYSNRVWVDTCPEMNFNISLMISNTNEKSELKTKNTTSKIKPVKKVTKKKVGGKIVTNRKKKI